MDMVVLLYIVAQGVYVFLCVERDREDVDEGRRCGFVLLIDCCL